MPLTKKGEKILKDFQGRYGKIEGKGFFYAHINKHPKETRGWHK